MHYGLAEGMQGECGESLRGVQEVPGEQIWEDAWSAGQGGCPRDAEAQRKMQGSAGENLESSAGARRAMWGRCGGSL